MTTRQAESQRRKQAQGQCRWCKNPAAPRSIGVGNAQSGTSARCEECKAKRRARRKAGRKG